MLDRNVEHEDKIDLIKDSYIIKMDGFPKDGPIAKAIVYFIVSKLNTIYESKLAISRLSWVTLGI